MEDEPEDQEEGLLLVEGWMFGAFFFPQAMAEVLRVPPANDDTPVATPPGR